MAPKSKDVNLEWSEQDLKVVKVGTKIHKERCYMGIELDPQRW